MPDMPLMHIQEMHRIFAGHTTAEGAELEILHNMPSMDLKTIRSMIFYENKFGPNRSKKKEIKNVW
jgi:hypothetical protein